MGLFDAFDKAKDNYERRRAIDEYNYRAREYTSDGQRIYEEAYNKLCDACWKVDGKVYDYQRYKQNILFDINRALRSLDSSHKDYHITSSIDIPALDSCAVHQEEKLDVIDKMLATWTPPSVTDFFGDNTMDYYEAKANMNKARHYKDMMKMKREELRNAREAVLKIPDFIYDEKKQIDELMKKFNKTVQSINSEYSPEKAAALKQIAEMIAESMKTQFINNNYMVTDQYKAVSSRFRLINDSLSSYAWLIGG